MVVKNLAKISLVTKFWSQPMVIKNFAKNLAGHHILEPKNFYISGTKKFIRLLVLMISMIKYYSSVGGFIIYLIIILIIFILDKEPGTIFTI
jgi:hypothetical protein